MKDRVNKWILADHAHCWHPFTDQENWESNFPVVICRGKGSWLFDVEGKRYLDANSSIWTNIHGHSHPVIVEAIQDQATKLCHSSYLGLANDKASELAEKLCSFFPDSLERCFFSDDGSTALEVAFKMSLQWRQQNGQKERTGIIAFENAYHGDTLGASSVGGVSRFIKGYGETGLNVYRIGSLEDLQKLPEVVVETASALVIEPLIQGVNQMRLWPKGMLADLRAWTTQYGIHLILDEVMTGFGRTGKMFACQNEEVIPDFLCLAKGLTGGTMPLAATLTKREIYEGFKGPERTFFYGHSYTGNALGCAVALANLSLFESENTLAGIEEKGAYLERELTKIPWIQEVRRVGLILGFDVGECGKEFCLKLRERGVLTRPILNTIVIMPPLSATMDELKILVKAIKL
ncbi:MAG TPA: adenosylmethionine--8-amino-7-oxononanoate transaminase [Verrucomicrobiales bacterium]|jgi:adenosylmethionine-8-amino-7-oxononanoate aminotransferase|nr:adenosylmethionine--8-amino-7-oxononanoate transaminase [Verrucomicrobiales bacterium]|tara:strand:- start:4923 stop:6140 length:1218 start_codon:yes stop_codon:yes gene_type:complete